MTTTTTDKKFVQRPLEELIHFELDNGAPVFFGFCDDICEQVESHGYQIYYVITMEKYTDPNDKAVNPTPKQRPQIMKVVNNIVGRAVIPASDEIQLSLLEKTAWFSLPKIPFDMIQQMDMFFRAADKKHGTEAIVILTFDYNMKDSTGWGFLVPEQKNTAAHCEYDHESIVDLIPNETTMIVGSAHSHPWMSAYASGTDHKDQADFDGLHITFGWQRAVDGGRTQYHIELQAGGAAFGFKPDQIFGDIPLPESDPRIEALVDKVKKGSTTTTWKGGSSVTSSYQPGGSYVGGGSSYSTGTVTATAIRKVPNGFPDPNANTIVSYVLTNQEGNNFCRLCEGVLIQDELDKRRCISCGGFLLLEGETLDKLNEARNKLNVYSFETDPSKNPPKAIYIWIPASGDKEDTVDAIYIPQTQGK